MKKNGSNMFKVCALILASGFIYSSVDVANAGGNDRVYAMNALNSAMAMYRYTGTENVSSLSTIKTNDVKTKTANKNQNTEVAKPSTNKAQQPNKSQPPKPVQPDKPKADVVEETTNNTNNTQQNTPVETKKPEAAKPQKKIGTFDASAYGYTGSDRISYWKNINPDVVGYLRIPGTNISHPVVQNTQDVNYYTHKNIYGQNDKYGVVWTNPDSNISGTADTMSDNTVLYGHNWKNVSANPRVGAPSDKMFEQLAAYHHTDMARSYPYIYYSTPEQDMTFVIFATFYTEIDFNYIQTDGANDQIIQEALQRSRNTFDVDVNANDKIITLSTCTRAYGSSDRQRFVVMGRMLRPGEEIKPIDVQYNPNHKKPSNLW